MTVRKDDTSPIKSIFDHKRPLKDHVTQAKKAFTTCMLQPSYALTPVRRGIGKV